MSVISFDDSHLASWMRPQLTSIAIPHFELARRAVELLLIEQDAGGVHRIPMPLRERGSVGPPGPTARRGRGARSDSPGRSGAAGRDPPRAAASG